MFSYKQIISNQYRRSIKDAPKFSHGREKLNKNKKLTYSLFIKKIMYIEISVIKRARKEEHRIEPQRKPKGQR